MNDAPYLPASDVKVERAVGRFIIAWGALEREIDSAIHDLLFTNLRTGMKVTANLAMRGKLDLVHALFEELRAGDDAEWRPVSKEWEVRFDKLMNETLKANSDARIPIVHSQPVAIRLDEGDRPFFMRSAARKGGWKGSGVAYSKKYLDDHTKVVVALVHEWAAARAHWDSAVRAIRSADADEWLGRGPDETDSMALTFQPIGQPQNSAPRQKKAKKPAKQARKITSAGTR